MSKPSSNFHLQSTGGLNLSLHRISVAKLNDITLTYLNDKGFAGSKKLQSRNLEGAAASADGGGGKSETQKLKIHSMPEMRKNAEINQAFLRRLAVPKAIP